MWLSEWYKDNPTRKWQKQKKKRLNIPLSNLFDSDMVKSIVEYIELFYFRHNLRKKADQINTYSKDHFIELNFDHTNKNATTTIHARHDGAIPNIIPLDQSSERAIKEALELGKVTHVEGKISVSNVPSELFDSDSNMEIFNFTIFPQLDDVPKLPYRILFKNDKGEVVHKENYLMLKPTQNGTKIRKWETEASAFFCSLTLDREAEELRWNFTPFIQLDKQSSPLKILERFHFLDAVNQSKSVEFEILTDGHISEGSCDFHIDMEVIQPYRVAIQNLIYITDIFKIEVNVPPLLNYEQINYIETIADILKTGKFDALIPQHINETDIKVTVEASYKKAQETLTSVKQRNEPILIQYTEDTYADIFENRLNLGLYDLVLHGIQFQNEDEIKQQMEQKSDNIQIVFQFDLEKSYTQFPKWLPQD